MTHTNIDPDPLHLDPPTLSEPVPALVVAAPSIVDAPPIAGEAPAAAAPPYPAAERALVIARACDIEMRSLEWLWPGRCALGKLSLMAGEPGLGKSQVAAALAAIVTTGGAFPRGDGNAPHGSVVMLSAEDDPGDTVVPRLVAAGADLARVRLVAAVEGGGSRRVRRAFNLQSDLDLLATAMREVGDVRLVVIDPITSYLGRGIDGNRNVEVRSVLDPVAELAARWRAAVIGITHFSKGGGASAINRFIGSIGFIAAARAAFVVTADPASEDPARRLFLPVKNNLAPLGHGLSFRIEQRTLDGGQGASAIAWGEDQVTTTAAEILGTATAVDNSARGAAEGFLRGLLAGGPQPVIELQAHATAAGISWRTLKRAKKAIGVEAERRAEPGDVLTGSWHWRLPRAEEPAQGAATL